MTAPSLAMALSGLALKSSPTSPASLVLHDVVSPSYSLSSSSPASSSLSNCSSSISSPVSGSAVAVQAATSGTMVGGASGVTAVSTTASAASGTATSGKDSGWLTLEVCREHIRQRCTRSEADCRFAHPPPHVDIQNGRVVCCFDSIKGRCQRTEPPCKYLHPPQHLKEQLLQNGRNNLIMKNLQQIQRIHQHSTVLPSAAAFFPMVNPYLVVNPSSWYPSYYNAASIQQGIVPTTSAHNGCVSIAPAAATSTATVAPAVEQTAPELEPCAATGVEVSYSNVQTVSQAGAQYWALSPMSPSGGHVYGTTSPYYSPCSAVYYQNGNYSIPSAAATTAMIVPKRATSTPANVVDGSGKNGYSAVYPCGSSAYQQMALSAGPVDMSSCYAMAITVPPPVNGFYGC